ncbi:MAG: glycosyltransferase family 2 protein [Nanoarchaeota archaeon]|nr:glycosyltransferase family 2 protein [Nanoarchaeota archaeon]MBU1322264.1 glycosyltransferase family 2 protein [Nanoarchaeota archaeon]MBU1598244.1 glycosyltransferase family 2 protein [Nanoarchaeota archaeon]MBU2441997.1 glycosyltransferase family 2 protein [Nanoarchaeota archaeon]
MKKNIKKKKIFFIIPGYNEEKSIGKVIKELKKAGYNNIVVIDDGSKDNTYQEAKKQNIFVLQHAINRGQGAALRTGTEFALKKGAEIIVHFDSDGQHRVEDLPQMLKPVLKGEVDVALGSRFLKKTKMPFSRRVLLKGSVWIQWLFYGVKLSDAHNGFRVMSRKAAQKIKIDSDRMEHASEIVEEIVKKKIKYKEVPVIIRYTGYSMKKGEGSFWGAVRILFKMIIKKIMH